MGIHIVLGELIMIPEFKLKISTTLDITLNIKVQLERTRSHTIIYVQDSNTNGRFVISITFSLRRLHLIIKGFWLITLNKVDKKA